MRNCEFDWKATTETNLVFRERLKQNRIKLICIKYLYCCSIENLMDLFTTYFTNIYDYLIRYEIFKVEFFNYSVFLFM